jgi:pilus assembly protein FimV
MEATPIDEIEAKLDFFFGSETEEEGGMEGLAERGSLLHERGAEEQAEIAPALSDVSSAALSEEEEEPVPVATVVTEAGEGQELEQALDLFFETEQETAAAIPVPADQLAEALEATLEGGQILPEENRHIQLAALGALLPIIVRTPSRDKVAEAATMITTLQQLPLSSEQHALVQLLNSVITLAMRLPTRDSKETEKLVNYLYQQLLPASCPSDVLPTAVSRFSAWLQQASVLMPQVPVATAAGEAAQEEPQFAYTGKELYFELSELRCHIKEEFAKLRHELHHHHG